MNGAMRDIYVSPHALDRGRERLGHAIGTGTIKTTLREALDEGRYSRREPKFLKKGHRRRTRRWKPDTTRYAWAADLTYCLVFYKTRLQYVVVTLLTPLQPGEIWGYEDSDE